MMRILRPLSYILFLIPLNSMAEISCRSTCPGAAKFFVNLQDRCMCLSSGECFKIDIGKSGPSMTTSGIGKTHPAHGAKYQTIEAPPEGTVMYDKDAIATGIPGNDSVGKWIHKTQGCAQGGNTATKGCIAVPCDVWPLVKKEMGQPITICGSSSHYNGPSEAKSKNDLTGESEDSGNSKGAK